MEMNWPVLLDIVEIPVLIRFRLIKVESSNGKEWKPATFQETVQESIEEPHDLPGCEQTSRENSVILITFHEFGN